MLRRSWSLARSLAGGLTLLLVWTALAQDTSPAPKKGKDLPDPPRTALYMNQLRALFALWDTDKNDYLDKEELAVAFRGLGAKPFDYREAKKAKEAEKKAEDKSDKDASDKDTPDKAKDKAAKTPDYSPFADYLFLTQLDKDRDDQISRDEFMEWAREYAIQVRDQAEMQKKLLELQKQLAAVKPKAKNKKTLEDKVKKQQADLTKLQDQMKKYAKVQGQLK